MRNAHRSVLVAVAVAVIAAACSSADTTTTTTTDPPTTESSAETSNGVVFGRGEIPASVPENFPIPEQASIGTTLVDHIRKNTEMTVIFPADVGAVVTYYTENLPGRGFEIVSSDGSETSWVIVFAAGDLDGELRLQSGGAGLTAGTVKLGTA